MKFVALSDTHGCHRSLDLPKGDVLLHAGDVCNKGNEAQVQDFVTWFAELDYAYKIFISGNHDRNLKRGTSLIPQILPKEIIFLEDTGVQIGDLQIWGTKERHPDWEKIPSSTDILLTHVPPYDILDKPPYSTEAKGSKSLLHKVQAICPTVHLFGHIHASYGTTFIDNTLFINASAYRASRKRIVNAPMVFEL